MSKKKEYFCDYIEKNSNKYKQNITTIHGELVAQLGKNMLNNSIYLDLIGDYMRLFDIKTDLINDIVQNGVKVVWNNGKQEGTKKNDSISELVKVNIQMLKILESIGLKPPPNFEPSVTPKDNRL